MQKKINIAIDGFSSCGKSTLANQLAKALSYSYIDSGAMYRAVTLFAIEKNIIGDDFFYIDKLVENLDAVEISFAKDGNGKNICLLNGVNVENEIRQPKVASLVSNVSSIAEVRSKMVDEQRKISQTKGVVMDGRDIGTVVFPDAELKIFITANENVRAERRYKEMLQKGIEVKLDDVLANLRTRDYLDQTRAVSPLKKAVDAEEIDNSELTLDEQFEVALKLAKLRINEGCN